jgi:hypothetical protein
MFREKRAPRNAPVSGVERRLNSKGNRDPRPVARVRRSCPNPEALQSSFLIANVLEFINHGVVAAASGRRAPCAVRCCGDGFPEGAKGGENGHGL